MAEEKETLFRIRAGYYLGGGYAFEVVFDNSGIHAKSCSSIGYDGNGGVSVIDLTFEEYDELEACLNCAGVNEWFCNYDASLAGYLVLDGVTWGLTYKDIDHSGSNYFPKGFSDVVDYLAEHFGCEGLKVYSDFCTGGSYDPILHIVEDSCMAMGRESTMKLLRDLGRKRTFNPDIFRRASRNLAHDLDLLAKDDSRFKDPRSVIEGKGIVPTITEIKALDAPNADPETIVAAMIFILTESRNNRSEDDFTKCIEDGTFERWIGALSDKIERSSR